jgi:hypothetical protein
MEGKNVLLFLYFSGTSHSFSFGRTTAKVITRFEGDLTKSLGPKASQLEVSIMFTTGLNYVSF